MKTKTITCFLLISFFVFGVNGQNLNKFSEPAKTFDYITAFIDTLNHLAEISENEFFRIHCESMVAVIESKVSYTSFDSSLLEDTYQAFNNEADTCNAKDLSTYLKRRRSFILSWVSPTDGTISFTWMKPPANWDPEKEYPLYIQLHGLWDVAGNLIQYLTYPYLNNPSTSIAFEDGYLLSPWGRGNLWYQGISETDIWEGLAAFEEIVYVNPARKYLSGHSMGGYGAWHIGIGSANTWAALGIHAGALWYGGSVELNSSVADILKNVPTYFVCGTNDGLLSVNQQAYELLQQAGNQNLAFVTFEGGHEYIEENVIDMYLWMKQFVNNDWSDIDIHDSPVTVRHNYLNCKPNPFQDKIELQCSIPVSGSISLEIFFANGKKTATIVVGELVDGQYIFHWEPEHLPNGIYFAVLKTNSMIETTKLIYFK